MKLKIFAAFAASAITLFTVGGSALAKGIYTSGTVGNDVSWPNCSARLSTVAFGIVGVTNGQGYSTNPCLASEASHYPNLSLYVNTGWYSASTHINDTSPRVCAAGDNNCLAYNYGYNAGLYAYSAAASAGVYSKTWWLDAETSNTWGTNVIENQNSLQGEKDALTAQGIVTVGVYSTTAQWQSITGGWQNGLPNWGASTWTTAKQAAKYCTGHDFTGGGTWIIQFNGKIDQDYAC